LNVRRAPISETADGESRQSYHHAIRFASSLKPGYRNVGQLRTEYKAKRPAIEARLEDFRRAGRLADERLFEELCFCIVAVQSKARASDAAVAALRETELLWSGEAAEIAAFLRHRTRFHNHKAAYIVRARDRLFPEGRGETAKPFKTAFAATRHAQPHSSLVRGICQRSGVVRMLMYLPAHRAGDG